MKKSTACGHYASLAHPVMLLWNLFLAFRAVEASIEDDDVLSWHVDEHHQHVLNMP
jgi:hypothetical protein